MRLGRLLIAGIVAMACVAGAPASARAQESAGNEYNWLIDEALAEFDSGHFEEALSAFEQAFKLKPSARALRGTAKAHFERRAYTRCLSSIEQALASDVEPLTDALRADLESLKTRAQRFVGEAMIEVLPTTASVVLDGEPIDLGV